MSKSLKAKEPVLQVKKLRKVYSSNGIEVEVLTGLNCEIFEGETVGILGTSGVGKTTFLHILGTLDRPSSGIVLHLGQDVFAWNDKRLSSFRNKEIGFVFQFHHLLPEFTALENVMMPCLVAKIAKSDAKVLAEEMLCELDLEHRINHLVGKLSGGEQQRVALARAMVRRPKILLADEPTGNLDEKTGSLVAEMLFGLNKRFGTTVVVVTHNPGLAARMDRCIGIKRGKAHELMVSDLKGFGME